MGLRGGNGEVAKWWIKRVSYLVIVNPEFWSWGSLFVCSCQGRLWSFCMTFSYYHWEIWIQSCWVQMYFNIANTWFSREKLISTGGGVHEPQYILLENNLFWYFVWCIGFFICHSFSSPFTFSVFIDSLIVAACLLHLLFASLFPSIPGTVIDGLLKM